MGDQHSFQEPAQRRRGTRRRPEANDYDTLLPIQYYHCVAGGTSPSGEFRLFFAILEDALRCYVRDKHCTSGPKRTDFLDARKWFLARGMPHVFSFESVCAHLGLDADWLRARLESLAPSDFPMKQFHTRRRRLARIASGPRQARSTPSSNQNSNADASIANGNSAAHENGSTNGHAISEASLSGGNAPVESHEPTVSGHEASIDHEALNLGGRETSGE